MIRTAARPPLTAPTQTSRRPYQPVRPSPSSRPGTGLLAVRLRRARRRITFSA